LHYGGVVGTRQAIFREVLTLYNESHSPPLNMVLFDFALDHLSRIHRVLRMPQGHCLCIGVGGSGKVSLIRLAAFTADCDVFEIMLARGYNEAAFREDLKVAYHNIISAVSCFSKIQIGFYLSGTGSPG